MKHKIPVLILIVLAGAFAWQAFAADEDNSQPDCKKVCQATYDQCSAKAEKSFSGDRLHDELQACTTARHTCMIKCGGD